MPPWLFSPWLLTVCAVTPTLAALALLALPAAAPPVLFRRLSLVALTVSWIASALMVWPVLAADALPYEGLPADRLALFPLVHDISWIPAFHIRYALAVDGLSLPLVLLTTTLAWLAMAASSSIADSPRGYCALFLILTTGMIGCFLAVDLFLFYVCFEMILVPMYFLIGLWGGPRRAYAAMKFFLYTLLGSVLILLAILVIYFASPVPADGFDLRTLPAHAAHWPRSTQLAIFWLLLVGFAVKLPVFPFHTWLPDAHVEAPAPISMILAGVLLKLGGYGLIRIAWPLCPLAVTDPAIISTVMIFAAINIVYGGAVALGQTDLKRLVAYSSVSHMGFVLLGLGSLTLPGHTGAVFQMVAHGIYSAALFLAVGVLQSRFGHRDIAGFGGLIDCLPALSILTIIPLLAAMGLPGLCGFPGEALALLGAFSRRPWITAVSATGLVLAAAYVVWTIQRVFVIAPAGPVSLATASHGPLSDNTEADPPPGKVPDVSSTPRIILATLAVLAIVLGVVPGLLTGLLGLRLPHILDAIRHAAPAP